MPRVFTTSGLLLAFGIVGCDRDLPTKPEARTAPASEDRVAATTDTVALTLAPDDISGLAVAIEDVRSRILPTLGEGAPVVALGAALAELEAAIAPVEAVAVEGGAAPAGSRAEATVLERALSRAEAAAARLQANEQLLPDLDVVLLVLERIRAVHSTPRDTGPEEGGKKP